MTAVDTLGIHGPAVTKITVADMADKLLTLDTVRERLAQTEPMTSVGFPVSDRIGFRMESGCFWDHETVQGDQLVKAYLTVGDSEYQMSKDALLEATSLCGLPQAYVLKSPSKLIEPHLNFWYKGGFDNKEYKALVVGNDKCLAVTRGTIEPFSNLGLLDQALDAISEKYGDGEVYVDPKFEHSLRQTSLRLIIPEYMRVMAGTGLDNDTWSMGIQIMNSLIGQSQTSIDGYMFRWWCTNGAIDTLNNSGKWSRKSGGQGEEDVMEWARQSVDSVLGGLEGTLDKVQAMADINIEEDSARAILEEIFNTYRIPGQARQLVIDNMVDETNMTMYSVMQAITAAANHPDVDPKHIVGLMECGGSLPHTAQERCNACHRFTATAHVH